MKRFASAIAGAIFIVLTGFFADSAINQAQELSWDWSSITFAAAILVPITALSLAACAYILSRKDDRSITRAALALLLVSLVCRLVWVSRFDSYQLNDFLYYLNCGADVALSGKPADSDFCGPTEDFVYWKRSAFFTYPIALLFGKSLVAVEFANVFMATLTGWFFFLAGRMLLGARVSALGLVFFIWHPDLWYAMTLASHDVPGLLCLALFFYIAALLRQELLGAGRGFRLTGLSLALGCTIFLLAEVRSYHYGAILALAIYLAFHVHLLLTAGADRNDEVSQFVDRRYGIQETSRARLLRVSALHVSAVLLIPVLVYTAADSAFWRSHGVYRRSEGGLACYLSSINVLGAGEYEELENWYGQCAELGGAERTAFAVRKVLHDITHDPREFLNYLVRKNRVLGHVGDYLDWSTATEHDPDDTSYVQVKRINTSNLESQELAVFAANSAMMLLVVCRFLFYPAIRFKVAETIPLVFSAAYYSLFLFLLESQGRYLICLVFVFPWMVGEVISYLWGATRRTDLVSPYNSRKSVYLGGVCVLVSALCLFWVFCRLVADSWLTLRDQAGFAPVTQRELAASGDAMPDMVPPVFVSNNHKQLMLAYPSGHCIEPGTVMAVQRSFKLSFFGTHHLRFFLSTGAVHTEAFAGQLPWNDARIEYSVLMNGRRFAAGMLQDIEDNRYFSLDPQSGLEFTPEVTLQLVLRNITRIPNVDPKRGPLVALEYIDLQ